MRILALVLLNLTLWILPVQAQLWSGVLDAKHAIDWSQAGIPGGIPNRTTQCGATINAYSGTTATINTAINACPAGQFVNLGAGTFTFSSGNINMKSNVTLRGQGASSTNLVFTALNTTTCSNPGTEAVCFHGSFNYYQSAENSTNWTAGYTKGTSVITVASTANMAVGNVLILDQAIATVDAGGIIISDQSPFISSAGTPAACRTTTPRRCQQEYHEIVAINGSNITITPPLQMPNWNSSQNPQVWYGSSQITLAGIEDLTINTGAAAGFFNFHFFNAHKCWLKGVRSIQTYNAAHPGRAHVQGLTASNVVIRDSYFYGTKNQANLSYGIETFNAGNWLVENNIFEHLVSPIVPGTGAGNVYGYNYSVDHYCTDAPGCNPSWNMPGPMWGHDAGSTYILQEGNQGTGTVVDALHGSSCCMTVFRNQFAGRDAGRTSHTQVVELNIYQRYANLIGNVMGEAGYHTKYTTIQPDGANCSLSIYSIGWDTQGCGGSRTDALTAATMMRWGNYDVVNNAVRFVGAEVPSIDAFFPNAVPVSQILPPSFYLPTRPTSWWTTPWGTPPWPPVGPEVTGGNVTSGSGGASNLGGHAYKIPARLCYENTSKTGGILNFDATACYSAAPSDTTPPVAPTNLRVS